MAAISNPITGSSEAKRGPASDPWFLFATVMLMVVGLMSLYSEGVDRDGLSNFKRQLIATFIGIGPFLLMRYVNPKFWRAAWIWLYAFMLMLLMGTLALGADAKGAQRWIDIGPMQFQPSELAKLLLVLTLSTYYAHRNDRINHFSTFLGGLAHVAIPVTLVLMQPHLGAAMVLLATWFAITLIAGVPIKYLAGFLGGFAILVGGVLAIPNVSDKLLRGYQADRVKGMFSKDKDRKGDNWQTDRAEIAFGVGGLFGTGFLKGEQKRGGFIPEQRNDFVFTVVGEEGGLVGSSLVLVLFALFFYRIFLAMAAATEPFYRMALAGVFAVLGFHTVVNLGMIMQLLPVVGLWLPFLSSGGTAIWLCMACVGLVINIRKREKPILF